jgi:hypothetical protein
MHARSNNAGQRARPPTCSLQPPFLASSSRWFFQRRRHWQQADRKAQRMAQRGLQQRAPCVERMDARPQRPTPRERGGVATPKPRARHVANRLPGAVKPGDHAARGGGMPGPSMRTCLLLLVFILTEISAHFLGPRSSTYCRSSSSSCRGRKALAQPVDAGPSSTRTRGGGSRRTSAVQLAGLGIAFQAPFPWATPSNGLRAAPKTVLTGRGLVPPARGFTPPGGSSNNVVSHWRCPTSRDPSDLPDRVLLARGSAEMACTGDSRSAARRRAEAAMQASCMRDSGR